MEVLRRFADELPLVDALAAVEGRLLESQLAITFVIAPIMEGAGWLGAAGIELLRVESLLLAVRLGVELKIAVILGWVEGVPFCETRRQRRNSDRKWVGGGGRECCWCGRVRWPC